MSMRFVLFPVLLLCLSSASAMSAPRVVVSLPPLQEVAAAVIGDPLPDVIITGHASAHHFALKPSHMQRLQAADLVIWIDRGFESGFQRLPDVLPATTAQLELARTLALATGDGHIWYSPRLLARAAVAIADALAGIDPANAARYRDNAQRLGARLDAWRERAAPQLASLSPAVITDHAFLEHFTRDFGLAPVAALHDQHDASGSLRELRALETDLAGGGIRCLLTLESHLSPLARKLVERYDLRSIDLDAGPRPPPAADAVLARLERLLDALRDCAPPG